MLTREQPFYGEKASKDSHQTTKEWRTHSIWQVEITNIEEQSWSIVTLKMARLEVKDLRKVVEETQDQIEEKEAQID
jgi:hypothetical protein